MAQLLVAWYLFICVFVCHGQISEFIFMLIIFILPYLLALCYLVLCTLIASSIVMYISLDNYLFPAIDGLFLFNKLLMILD